MWGAHFDERTGLPFTNAAHPLQRSYSWVPWDSWPYFTVSDSRISQPGGPGPRIYIPPEQGAPVIPPDTELSTDSRYIDLAWTYRKHASRARMRGKLQRLQNRVLRAISNLDRRTPVRDLHLAFKIPYVYDYIDKLSRRQAEARLNHQNPSVHAIGQGEARHRKHNRFKLGGCQA
jgi:hypothetical protein